MKRICVLGSINMDLVMEIDKLPINGETLLSEKLSYMHGGKGANQAVAAVRQGCFVTMLGCVGNDGLSDTLIDGLRNEGIDTSHIEKRNMPSGQAAILKTKQDNSIIVNAGANMACDVEYVKKHSDVIADSDALILQCEIPLDSVYEAMNIAHQHRVPIFFNPAPSCELNENMVHLADVITPNEHEFQYVIGQCGDETLEDAMKTWQKEHPHTWLVVTRGSKGVSWCEGDNVMTLPACKVENVDTTGAGDTFHASLSIALLEGKCKHDAITWARDASALAITKLGARSGMGTKGEIEAFMECGTCRK